MAETGGLSEAELDAIDAEVMAEIEQSVTDAKAAARPTAEQTVYCDNHTTGGGMCPRLV